MSAGSSGSNTDNKVRFDLKQISQWDKQIKQDYQKKIQKGTGSQQHHQGHRHHSSRSNECFIHTIKKADFSIYVNIWVEPSTF